MRHAVHNALMPHGIHETRIYIRATPWDVPLRRCARSVAAVTVANKECATHDKEGRSFFIALGCSRGGLPCHRLFYRIAINKFIETDSPSIVRTGCAHAWTVRCAVISADFKGRQRGLQRMESGFESRHWCERVCCDSAGAWTAACSLQSRLGITV